MISLTEKYDLGGFSPVGGALELSPLVQAQPNLAGVDATLARASVDVAAIDTSNVLGQVRAATLQLSWTIESTEEKVAGVNRAVQLLPAMLGADGQRSYLLLFQKRGGTRNRGDARSFRGSLDGERSDADHASGLSFRHRL